MLKKIKVLSINEDVQISSGYSCYSRGILTELNKNPNFEVAEMALFYNPIMHDKTKDKWKVIPCLPKELLKLNGKNDSPELLEGWQKWNQSIVNPLGRTLLEDILLEYQPDTILINNDEFNVKFIFDSPYRRFFNIVWLAACDGIPQNDSWIETMSNSDGLLTYSEWGKNAIENQCPKVKVHGFAPPAGQESFQILNKALVREEFGLNNDVKIVGTVMRNQRRKRFPELFRSFKKYLEQTRDENTYLYCHTRYPDGAFRIPELIQEFGIANRVLFTYSCLNCGHVFCSKYQDLAECPKCRQISAQMPGTANGVSSENLCKIYNLFDLYVQYSSSEGFALPLVECASCGVHSCCVDYSAMKDSIKFLDSEPIRVAGLYREMETGVDRAVPDDDHFIELLTKFLSKPKSVRNSMGIRARLAFEKNFGWEQTGEVWANTILNSYREKQPWNSPIVFFEPKPLTEKELHGMSNIEFVRWLLVEVACKPDKVGTYYENEIIRNLNYNCRANMVTNGGNQFYNREIAYSEHKQIGEVFRVREIQRGRYFGII